MRHPTHSYRPKKYQSNNRISSIYWFIHLWSLSCLLHSESNISFNIYTSIFIVTVSTALLICTLVIDCKFSFLNSVNSFLNTINLKSCCFCDSICVWTVILSILCTNSWATTMIFASITPTVSWKYNYIDFSTSAFNCAVPDAMMFAWCKATLDVACTCKTVSNVCRVCCAKGVVTSDTCCYNSAIFCFTEGVTWRDSSLSLHHCIA